MSSVELIDALWEAHMKEKNATFPFEKLPKDIRHLLVTKYFDKDDMSSYRLVSKEWCEWITNEVSLEYWCPEYWRAFNRILKTTNIYGVKGENNGNVIAKLPHVYDNRRYYKRYMYIFNVINDKHFQNAMRIALPSLTSNLLNVLTLALLGASSEMKITKFRDLVVEYRPLFKKYMDICVKDSRYLFPELPTNAYPKKAALINLMSNEYWLSHVTQEIEDLYTENIELTDSARTQLDRFTMDELTILAERGIMFPEYRTKWIKSLSSSSSSSGPPIDWSKFMKSYTHSTASILAIRSDLSTYQPEIYKTQFVPALTSALKRKRKRK